MSLTDDSMATISLIGALATLIPTPPGGSVRFRSVENEPAVVLTLVTLSDERVVGRVVVGTDRIVAAFLGGTTTQLARELAGVLLSGKVD